MFTVSLSDSNWWLRSTKDDEWIPARVPGCVYSDLIRIGKIEDPFFGTRELDCVNFESLDWVYRSEFILDENHLNETNIQLVTDGLDTLATVSVNGKLVATSENMFVGHRWELRKALRVGLNEIVIHFASAAEFIKNNRLEFTPNKEFCDPVGNAVRIRKQPSQFGWDWAPRLISAGIWRDIRLEGWSENTLLDVRIVQCHGSNGVRLSILPEMAVKEDNVIFQVACFFNGSPVASIRGKQSDLEFFIESPSLWWPSGLGDQSLYVLEIRALSLLGCDLGLITKKVGLRTLQLEQKPDEWGESFQFVVNGYPVFAKGANWIPAHSFVSTLTRKDYERDLRAAKNANMNCIRVWGGGIYESEDFYDLCDELGLMVWQDFMFSCALYPYDDAFVASVADEAEYQIRRLRHRACLALWCGNNEIAQLNMRHLLGNSEMMAGYRKLFHETIPEVLDTHDDVTSYIPTSEWRGVFESGHELGERSGDTHYWDVWHSRHPVKDYEKWAFRFCSEFGMQSYCSPETNATFCPPEDRNLFGPSMENHQKNSHGNQVILYYVSNRYRYPKNQEALIYLSQLNQAYCLKVGVEHFRRLMPRCMGSLYWQLNDCWPVTSWSSIEFSGRWKALHYEARRFYSPHLVSMKVWGHESMALGNYRKNDVKEVSLFTVSDDRFERDGKLAWSLFHFDGHCLKEGSADIRLRYGESVEHLKLNFADDFAKVSRDHLYLRAELRVDDVIVSEQTEFFAPPRFLQLRRNPIHYEITNYSDGLARICLKSETFQHAIKINFRGFDHEISDNYFNLHPDRTKEVEVRFRECISRDQIKESISIYSLVDSYED